MITTGSVRGKCCVRQDGQSRRQPPSTRLLAAPQFGQKRWRAWQPTSALPSASGGRGVGAGGMEPAGESRRAVVEAEKDGLRRAAERARFRRREQRVVDLGALLQH